MLTQEYLKSILSYNKDTGSFTWLKNHSRIPHGKEAGSIDKYTKYRYIRISGKNYLAHRLAWLYVYGVWPKNQIDHINHNRSDNRIENLKDVTIKGNAHNRIYYKNKENLVGARFHKIKNKWESCVSFNNKRYYIGSYTNQEDARGAYLAMSWLINEVSKL